MKDLHPRNRHRGRYDFKKLIRASPGLAKHVAINKHGDESIDFARPEAVKALNQAILELCYGISDWDIPQGYLCPPIPGRVDYLHHAADLIDGVKGEAIRVLDIGCGANCVYPLVGNREYGWSFVGSDIDSVALKSAEKILKANPDIRDAIELRFQKSKKQIFEGVVKTGERFDLTVCNPPFHASMKEARRGTNRKWRNLGKASPREKNPVLNFGGIESEICCEGGEREFIGRMIEEGARFAAQCGWFTVLVSNAENLPSIGRDLKKAQAREQRIIEMAQGQKRSRIVAWRF